MRKIKTITMTLGVFVLTMCVPPEGGDEDDFVKEKARLDSLRELRCPRLMSSAAEYYRNQDWKQTITIYEEITSLDCDEWNPTYAPPQEIYQYYAIAYEQLGKFDSAEYVLLDGLQKLPNNVQLRKRLAYSYKRQGKKDKEIIEYERMIELEPDNITIMNDLSTFYKEEGLFDDQVHILQKILDIDSGDENAQSELAVAYEKSGKDPLDIYKNRFEENPNNINYGIDYAERLIQADNFTEAVSVFERVVERDSNNKLAYRKLAEANRANDDLGAAAQAYEELFKIDPRDIKVAISLSDVFLENQDFGKALRWADEAISLKGDHGEGFGQKGKVYFFGWKSFRTKEDRIDDRIVAKLSYNNYVKADNKGFRGVSQRGWLEENSKDILYGKSHWFMAEDKVKRSQKIRTVSPDYKWVTEFLTPDSNWK